MNALSPDFIVNVNAPTRARVAVLVDGDNFPHSDLFRLESFAAEMGDVVIRRVFGDVKKVGGWPEAEEYQMLHCDSSSGKKNLADMRLAVAALDIAHRGLAIAFVIASDDRDFQPVIQYLIENGATTSRLRKMPTAVLQSTIGSVITKIVQPSTALSAVDQTLLDILKSAPNGLTLIAIGSTIRNGSVKTQTGKKTWRAYFESNTGRYTLEGTGRETLVRLKHFAPHTAP